MVKSVPLGKISPFIVNTISYFFVLLNNFLLSASFDTCTKPTLRSKSNNNLQASVASHYLRNHKVHCNLIFHETNFLINLFKLISVRNSWCIIKSATLSNKESNKNVARQKKTFLIVLIKLCNQNNGTAPCGHD